jgi:hypothetical protein
MIIIQSNRLFLLANSAAPIANYGVTTITQIKIKSKYYIHIFRTNT